MAHYNARQLGSAEDAARKLIRKFPRSTFLANFLGGVQADQGVFEKAIACFKKALKIDPAFVEAHNNMGNALRKSGNPKDALDCYKRALQIRPKYAKAHNNHGAALHDLGEYEEAVVSYGLALEIEPRYAKAYCTWEPHFRSLARLRTLSRAL